MLLVISVVHSSRIDKPRRNLLCKRGRVRKKKGQGKESTKRALQSNPQLLSFLLLFFLPFSCLFPPFNSGRTRHLKDENPSHLVNLYSYIFYFFHCIFFCLVLFTFLLLFFFFLKKRMFYSSPFLYFPSGYFMYSLT